MLRHDCYCTYSSTVLISTLLPPHHSITIHHDITNHHHHWPNLHQHFVTTFTHGLAALVLGKHNRERYCRQSLLFSRFRSAQLWKIHHHSPSPSASVTPFTHHHHITRGTIHYSPIFLRYKVFTYICRTPLMAMATYQKLKQWQCLWMDVRVRWEVERKKGTRYL